MRSKSSPVRVAHLVSHPIQYFVPLYRALAQRPEIDLTVYYFSVASLKEHVESGFGRAVKWDVPLIGGYRHLLKGDAESRPLAKKPEWKPNWGILRDLVRQRYDVIWLHGYSNANAWLTVALAKLMGTPVMLRDDQTLLSPRSSLNRRIKKMVLPPLFRNISALYVGESNRAYFESFGTKKFYRASHSVDNSFFASRRAHLLSSRPDLRQRFGVSDDAPVILFSGKFVDKKRPLLLLEAFSQVRRTHRCHLLLVGDGPLRPEIEKTIAANQIPDVHLAGFLNQTEIPSAYCAADLLVLPSAYQETWGLVVNEAMNFALPIIVSDRVGCAADLVEEGRNGFVFPSGDATALAQALRTLVESPALRSAFGDRSLEMIQAYGIEAVTDQVVSACVYASGGAGGAAVDVSHMEHSTTK